MQQRMKLTILISVLLVSVVWSEYIDYCGIEPRACAVHIFNIGEDDSDKFICQIQPLKYNRSKEAFESSGNSQYAYATTVNGTAVQCKLEGIQSAAVGLWNEEQRFFMDAAFIYPTLCFEKCSDFSCNITDFTYAETPLYGFEVWQYYGGCFVDNVCHPHFVLNPANHSQWCSRNNEMWTGIANAAGIGSSLNLVNMCKLGGPEGLSSTGNITRASVPEQAGTEGLDLTADGAYCDLEKNYGFTIEANFKFYAKFGPEPITETETFFEYPSMLKIKRTPYEEIIVEYTFLNAEANQVFKVVSLAGSNENDKEVGLSSDTNEKGWLQLIGIKMNVNHQKNKRNEGNIEQEAAKWIQDEWNMIGFSYNIYDGAATLMWYLNGQKVEVDHGNITGLYLRADRGPILSHGQFSCFESIGLRKNDLQAFEEFHTNRNLTGCMEAYTGIGKTDEDFSACEREYYSKMG